MKIYTGDVGTIERSMLYLLTVIIYNYNLTTELTTFDQSILWFDQAV